MSRFSPPAPRLEAHVEACKDCVVVGCMPRTLCAEGRALWAKWAARLPARRRRRK